MEREEQLAKAKSICIRIIPYLIYFLILLFYHIYGYQMDGDDQYVVSVLKPSLKQELPGLMKRSCEGWSSRVLINPLIWILLHLDIRVWGALDILVLMVGLWCVICLCNPDRLNDNNNMIILGIVLMFPFDNFQEVGWVVTSVSYAWPLVAALLACMTVKHFFEHQKNSWWSVVPMCLLTVFAVNKEELSVTLAIIFIYTVFLSIRKKRPDGVVCIQTVISVFGILFHLFNAGNRGRSSTFTEDAHMTGVDKLCMGFISTLHHLFFDKERNYFFLCMCILICIVTCVMQTKQWVKIISVIPLLLCAVSMITGVFSDTVECDTWRDTRLILPVVLALFGVTCILICMYQILQDRQKFLTVFILLFAGFAGRMTVGFSGTGLSAFIRTYTFLYYIILGVVAWFVIKCEDDTTVLVKKKILLNRVILWLVIISIVRATFVLAIV